MKITEVPTDPNTAVYFCPQCQAAFTTPEGASLCATARNREPLFSPGDIVTVEQGYGWHSSTLDAKLWVLDRNGHEFHDEPTFRFYYVVTAVHKHDNDRRPFRDPDEWDAHRWVYSVRSKAVNGGPSGWNSIEGHLGMTLAEDPPAEVVEQSKEFIGLEFGHLL